MRFQNSQTAPVRVRLGDETFVFDNLKTLLAQASPRKSGDELSAVAAPDETTRVAARYALADVPLERFLEEPLVPYEEDDVTRLIVDTHDRKAFTAIGAMTVGEFREWLLSSSANADVLHSVAPGLTPEMVAAVSKLCGNGDLVEIASKVNVVTAFRTTVGLEGRLSARLQPNHPTDDPKAIIAATLDGLLYGVGDAVIGINPATDNVDHCRMLLSLLDDLRQRLEIPCQTCVLTHVTNSIEIMERSGPVDLVFQSIAGSEGANLGFGVSLATLREAQDAALGLKRGMVGDNVMYFETGQGAALSAGASHGVDQQTMEARAYSVAREFSPLLVNSVVGFIGPEYLFDGRQITRAALEDHFCGKLLGLPMGCDVCYTNHAEADQNDMDNLALLLAMAGVNFLIAVPGSDDIMLNYQSLANHDIVRLRHLTRRRAAPEFESWLMSIGLADRNGRIPTKLAPFQVSQILAAELSA
ncbi:ethanolamine ammonia-lyase subunit EutB [Hoeflea sp. CAU 1731]